MVRPAASSTPLPARSPVRSSVRSPASPGVSPPSRPPAVSPAALIVVGLGRATLRLRRRGGPGGRCRLASTQSTLGIPRTASQKRPSLAHPNPRCQWRPRLLLRLLSRRWRRPSPLRYQPLCLVATKLQNAPALPTSSTGSAAPSSFNSRPLNHRARLPACLPPLGAAAAAAPAAILLALLESLVARGRRNRETRRRSWNTWRRV